MFFSSSAMQQKVEQLRHILISLHVVALLNSVNCTLEKMEDVGQLIVNLVSPRSAGRHSEFSNM